MSAEESTTKLLLVDDRADNLLVLETVLGHPGYSLILAHSGPEALALLGQHPDVALIVLDVQMPGMDGFEVARRVKAIPEFRDLPIIFVTAIYREDPHVREGYQAGGIDYFSKPFDPEILKMKVKIYAAFRKREKWLVEKEKQISDSVAILRSSRKLSADLESLSVGVIVADNEGRVCQTNEEALKILKSVQLTAGDSYGEFISWWEHDGQPLKRPNGALMRALAAGKAAHNEITDINGLDGSSKSVFISASPLRAPDSHIVGAVVVFQDVTAHRKIEADIEKRLVSLIETAVATR